MITPSRPREAVGVGVGVGAGYTANPGWEEADGGASREFHLDLRIPRKTMLGKALSEPCSEDLGPGPASTAN